MGKQRAARREQRKAKREVARESRTTKYARQKGGVIRKLPNKGARVLVQPKNDPDAEDQVIPILPCLVVSYMPNQIPFARRW